jgi:hypothetical protein
MLTRDNDDFLSLNRQVLAAMLKADPEGLTEERALDRLHSLLDELQGFEAEPVDLVRLRHGDHPSARYDASADTVTVTMQKPWQHGKETISELNVRAPRFGDMQAVADKQRRAGFELLARCCGRTVNELAGMHSKAELADLSLTRTRKQERTRICHPSPGPGNSAVAPGAERDTARRRSTAPSRAGRRASSARSCTSSPPARKAAASLPPVRPRHTAADTPRSSSSAVRKAALKRRAVGRPGSLTSTHA